MTKHSKRGARDPVASRAGGEGKAVRPHAYQITLTVRGPVVSRSTSAGAYGVDAVSYRSADKRPALPGPLVQGRLREAWSELAHVPMPKAFITDDDINAWLGEGGNEGDYAPRRGRLVLPHEFIGPASSRRDWRFRVSIDDDRGAARHMALQTIESPYQPLEEIDFEGTVVFLADRDETARIARALEVGLSWMTGLGAFTGIGFGRLLKVRVAEARTPQERPQAVSCGPRFGIKVTFDRPLCVAERQSDGNLFRSADVIPGGVLKGALAGTARQLAGEKVAGPARFPKRELLSTHFEHIAISHAVPIESTAAERPVAIPLSLAASASHPAVLRDTALESSDRLIDGEAPVFQPDWKEDTWKEARRRCRVSQPARQLAVRNQHDRDRHRAKDGALYAYEMVRADAHVWYADVSCERILDPAERSEVVEHLAAVLRWEIRDVGKTRAMARVEILRDPLPHPYEATSRLEIQDLDGGARGWIVALQTPAIMCDPEPLAVAPDPAATLHQLYAAFWAEMHPDLVLKRFFARQSLAGGEYLWKRFLGQRRPYYPYLLTDTGSVFVLEDSAGHATTEMVRLFRDGLTIPTWARRRYAGEDGREDGDHWSRNPFLPQNGYGHIAVNMPLHWSWR